MKSRVDKKIKLVKIAKIVFFLAIAVYFLLGEAFAHETEYEKELQKLRRVENRIKSSFKIEGGINYSGFPTSNSFLPEGGGKHGFGADFNFSYIHQGKHQVGVGLGTRYWPGNVSPDVLAGISKFVGLDITEDSKLHVLGIFVGFQYKYLLRYDPFIFGIGTGLGYGVMSTFTDKSVSIDRIFFPKKAGSGYMAFYPGIDLSYVSRSNFIFTVFFDYRILINTKTLQASDPSPNTIASDSHIDVGVRFGQILHLY